MLYIYVLQLTDDKYYVGRTSNVDHRVQQHMNGTGSAWTKKYSVVRVMESYEVDSVFYEDMVVKSMMHQFGIENVRGGSYCQIKLPEEQQKLLCREINGATDKCFHCGGNHFARDCIH